MSIDRILQEEGEIAQLQILDDLETLKKEWNTPLLDRGYKDEKPDLYDDPAAWGFWRQKKFCRESLQKIIDKWNPINLTK